MRVAKVFMSIVAGVLTVLPAHASTAENVSGFADSGIGTNADPLVHVELGTGYPGSGFGGAVKMVPLEAGEARLKVSSPSLSFDVMIAIKHVDVTFEHYQDLIIGGTFVARGIGTDGVCYGIYVKAFFDQPLQPGQPDPPGIIESGTTADYSDIYVGFARASIATIGENAGACVPRGWIDYAYFGQMRFDRVSA